MRFSKFHPLRFYSCESIRKQAYQIEAREACGVLVGHISDDTAYVDHVRQVKNLSENDDGFIMDPQEYLAAIMDTNYYSNSPQYELLGIYHTHPNFPGYPSSLDWKTADTGKVIEGMYLIFTTEGDSLHCYYWDGKQFIVLRRNNENN